MHNKIINKLPSVFNKYNIAKIESGASNKIFYRLSKNNETFIIIDFSLDQKEYENYLKIYNLLLKIDISIPSIIHKSDDNLIIICEDFGYFRFDKVLNKYSIKDLLKCAVDTLLIINKSIKYNKDYKLDQYNFKIFTSEIIELPNYYFSYINLDSLNLKKEFVNIWSESFEKINFEFNYFSHKDFNINNLIFMPSRQKHLKCGVIDFQSAFWGESSWDLFSLLEDSRIFFTDTYNEEFIKYFFLNANINSTLADFKTKYHFLNCSRQTRLLGRWVKLAKELNQNWYLNFIPVTINRLKKSIPFLNNKNLIKFYETHIINQ